MMLTTDLKLISTPVIVVINGEKKEYENGATACSAIKPDNRLEVKSITVRDGKIVVQFAEWETNAPFNYIGEAAVAY